MSDAVADVARVREEPEVRVGRKLVDDRRQTTPPRRAVFELKRTGQECAAIAEHRAAQRAPYRPATARVDEEAALAVESDPC